jgi:acyl carrier protein
MEPEVALADLGLDSLGTVGLLVELEETFNVVIPDEFLSAEMFATPKSLWDVIDQLVKEQSR